MAKTATEELLDMKKKIDAAALEKARLEGLLADRMKRLKDMGYSTVAVAEKRLKELSETIGDLDKQISDGVSELHKEFGL